MPVTQPFVVRDCLLKYGTKYIVPTTSLKRVYSNSDSVGGNKQYIIKDIGIPYIDMAWELY